MANRLRTPLVLLAAGALLVTACGGGATASPAASAAAKCEAGAAAGTQIPEIVDGKFNVAMVLIGPHNDGGWSQAHYEGLIYLCENMADSHVAYIENVPEGTDSEQVFRSLSRKGFDFIVGTSFGYMDPMEIVAGEFPDITYLHLTGIQVERQELRQLLRRDGELQVPRRHAGRVAREARRQPEDRLHGDVPDPGGAPARQRDHARRQADVPRVHDGHPVHQHLARSRPGEGGRGVAVRRWRAGRLHRRRHGRGRRRRPGEGQVGRHVRPSRLLQGRPLPDRPVLDLGPRVHPDRRAREGR